MSYSGVFHSLKDGFSDIKQYVDDEDEKFRYYDLFKVKAPYDEGYSKPIMECNFREMKMRLKNSLDPDPDIERIKAEDYAYCKDLLETNLPYFIMFLAKNFYMQPLDVMNKLNSWNYGAGIGCFFRNCCHGNKDALFRIRRMMEIRYQS